MSDNSNPSYVLSVLNIWCVIAAHSPGGLGVEYWTILLIACSVCLTWYRCGSQIISHGPTVGSQLVLSGSWNSWLKTGLKHWFVELVVHNKYEQFFGRSKNTFGSQCYTSYTVSVQGCERWAGRNQPLWASHNMLPKTERSGSSSLWPMSQKRKVRTWVQYITH